MRSQLLLPTLFMALLAPTAPAQMTVDQKVTDFMYMVGLYAKNYAPYEWKRDVMGFDLYDIKPWLDRIKASKDDLEFYDICVRYVASLQDSHASFLMWTDFVAQLPFDVDIYDGKVLIEQIYRSALPKARYPFNIGDELISVDGRAVMDLVEAYIPYAAGGSGSVSARRRVAAQTITSLYQEAFPRAPEVGDSATIVVRSPSGSQDTYVIPWGKAGTPIWNAGLVPSPNADSKAAAQGMRLARYSGVSPLLSVVYGRTMPAFDPPPGFRMRLGASQDDPFLSGTFQVSQHTVGFLRLPNMGSLDASTAPPQLAAEIAFFQSNTDALVIDLMHNPGGSSCYAENAAQYLIPRPFRGAASRLRATNDWLVFFSQLHTTAVAKNLPPSVILLYAGFVAQIQAAMKENRGMTGPIPICTPDYEAVQPAKDERGNALAYTKPILVLVDEFTRSAAEALTMFLQDEGRATILGVRTSGGGGAPATFPGGAYSGGRAIVTASMLTRKRPVSTPGFPTVDHIENVGVYPDIVVDYMTRDNLMTGGKTFVETFSRAVADLISRR